MNSFEKTDVDHANNPARRFGQRLFDFLIPHETVANAESLFNAARMCSELAKSATGTTRSVLYLQKAKCLKLLDCEYSNEIDIKGDNFFYPGLLSIQLKSLPHSRLHSHENWLAAA